MKTDVLALLRRQWILVAALPSVATGGTDNGELLGWPSVTFAGIASIKKVFEEFPTSWSARSLNA